MPTTEEWSVAIILNTIHIILIILIIYYFIRFYHFRKNQALQKRYPPLVYLQTLCIFFYVLQCILYKFAFIYGENNETDFEKNSNFTGYTLKLLSEIFYVFSSHGMLLTFAARSYIIYFNINWAIQMQKSKWSVHLNSDLSSFWFLRHHNDFGSKRYIYTFVFIYYIVVTAVTGILIHLNMGFQGYITILLIAIEIIVIFIIWNKIPKFHDVYYVKKELRICNYLALSALSLYIIWVVKVSFVGYTLWSFMLFQFLFGTLIGAIAIVINTYILSPKCRHVITGQEAWINMEQTVGKISKITDTLCSAELLPLFFKHLSDEFSVEILLAFVEFIQLYKLMRSDDEFMANLLTNQTGAAKVKQTDAFSNKFNFPPELPVSNIVYEKYENITDNIHRYLLIANDLFQKYVTSASEFEINISYNCKQEMVEFVDNYCNNLHMHLDQSTFTSSDVEKYRLLALYYDASIQLYRLMFQSHRRFITAILSDKDFRVDTGQNVAFKEIKSNTLMQQPIMKKGNVIESLKNRLSNSKLNRLSNSKLNRLSNSIINSGKSKSNKKEFASHLVKHESAHDLDIHDDVPTFETFSISAPSPINSKYVKRATHKSIDDIAVDKNGFIVDVASYD